MLTTAQGPSPAGHPHAQQGAHLGVGLQGGAQHAVARPVLAQVVNAGLEVGARELMPVALSEGPRAVGEDPAEAPDLRECQAWPQLACAICAPGAIMGRQWVISILQGQGRTDSPPTGHVWADAAWSPRYSVKGVPGWPEEWPGSGYMGRLREMPPRARGTRSQSLSHCRMQAIGPSLVPSLASRLHHPSRLQFPLLRLVPNALGLERVTDRVDLDWCAPPPGIWGAWS